MKGTRTYLFKIALSVVLFAAFAFAPMPVLPLPGDNATEPIVCYPDITSIYDNLQLGALGLNQSAFNLAIKGFMKLKEKGEITRDIISICDFSQSCNNKRMYVIDLSSGTLLYNTLVAHGRNTGEEFARYFSNQNSTHKSSLGFYVTEDKFNSKLGTCLRLKGMEPGFNDRAESRGIIVHGASYVSENFITNYGTCGRSWGCPAVPMKDIESVVDLIKDGTCLFIYAPDRTYMALSKMVK